MSVPAALYRAVPEKIYRTIAAEIASDDSPVGIDAKKTHIIILHQLARIEERLARIEAVLEAEG
jgi:hypothetical protein